MNALTLDEISKLPKVAIEISEEIAIKNDLPYNVETGWYALPVLNGLVQISSELVMMLSTRQKDQSAAMLAAKVHTTFDNKMSVKDWASLQSQVGGL